MECRTAQRASKKVNLHIYEKYYPLRLKKIRVCKFGVFFILIPSERENTLWRAWLNFKKEKYNEHLTMHSVCQVLNLYEVVCIVACFFPSFFLSSFFFFLQYDSHCSRRDFCLSYTVN